MFDKSKLAAILREEGLARVRKGRSRKTAGRPPRNAGEARELFEWGEWPGRGNFEWDYVETEGPKDLRFDWRRGSMWLRFYGGSPEAEGDIPPHFKKHLTKLGFDVY